jgi:FtsZ-interacting cell division protein ZipA
MLIIVIIGIGIIVALFAILAKIWGSKTKKAEKWEKAEIMKQLLALSEGENGSSAISAPPASDMSRKDTSHERNSKRRNSKASAQPASAAKPNHNEPQIEEKIRQRAYELYQARGGTNGNPTDDWLQAKQEVLTRKARAGKGPS